MYIVHIDPVDPNTLWSKKKVQKVKGYELPNGSSLSGNEIFMCCVVLLSICLGYFLKIHSFDEYKESVVPPYEIIWNTAGITIIRHRLQKLMAQ